MKMSSNFLEVRSALLSCHASYTNKVNDFYIVDDELILPDVFMALLAVIEMDEHIGKLLI